MTPTLRKYKLQRTIEPPIIDIYQIIVLIIIIINKNKHNFLQLD